MSARTGDTMAAARPSVEPEDVFAFKHIDAVVDNLDSRRHAKVVR